MINLAACIRYTAVQGWYVQNDDTHAPIGVKWAGVVNGKLRVEFTKASRVGSIVMLPDNKLTKAGYNSAGAECGLELADFDLTRDIDLEGGVRWDGDTPVAEYINPDFPFTVSRVNGTTIRVYHEEFGRNLIPVLQPRSDCQGTPTVGEFGRAYFDIRMLGGSCLVKRQGRVTVNPVVGYANEDGNFWLQGLMT